MAQSPRPPLELSALLFDFVFGGALVAGAVAVANLAGGLFAGVMAALPIRLAVSMVFIHQREGLGAVEEASVGMLYVGLGYLAFVSIFYLGLPRWNFWPTLALSALACGGATTLGYLVFRPLA